jgi:hypothetical protein
LAGNSVEDERNGDALANQIKIYLLAKADNPPAASDTSDPALVALVFVTHRRLTRMTNPSDVT